MRKVTREVCDAFMRHEKKSMGNTMTDGETLYLHMNAIARHTPTGITVTNAGWPTVTTRERLNGLPGVSVYQHKGEQYLNGKKWGGEWYNIEL